jgi:hypothetical protein
MTVEKVDDKKVAPKLFEMCIQPLAQIVTNCPLLEVAILSPCEVIPSKLPLFDNCSRGTLPGPYWDLDS